MSDFKASIKEFAHGFLDRSYIEDRSKVRQELLQLAELVNSYSDVADDVSFQGLPILECDYYVKVFAPRGLSGISTNWLNLPPGTSWRVWSNSPNFNPATINWDYHKDAIGFPIPSVSSNKCSISLAAPKDYATPFTMAEYLQELYGLQFSSSGLLAVPARSEVSIELGFTFSTIIRQKEECPLYEFQGVRLDTPGIKFNPASDQPAWWTFGITYRNSRTSTIFKQFPGRRFDNIDSIPDVEYHSDQFKDRYTNQ